MRLAIILIVLFGINTAWAETKPKVVATASIFADMAVNIGGDAITVESIVPIGGDPHIHEPTPRDAQLAAAADLILVNSLTFEGWLNELIANSGTNATVDTITKGIQPIESKKYKGSADPHAWMDAKNGLIYIENIKNALVRLDPSNKEMFEFNYGVYKKQLEDLDIYIKEAIQNIPKNQRVLITSHDAFQYFGRRYGLRLEAILGTSTDAEVQTSDIIRLNKIIKENNLPAVFIESTVNPKLLKQIATDNNIKVGGQLYSDSIGDENSDAPSYYDMLKFNTDVIVNALKQTPSADSVQTPTESTESNNWLMYGLLGLLLVGGFIFVISKVS